MMTHPYPDEPGAKRTGTSTDAAVSMKKKAPTLRAEVLALLQTAEHLNTGLTADEAARLMGESVLSIRPRFSELVEQGLIKNSGCWRENISGKEATVWLAVLCGEQTTLF